MVPDRRNQPVRPLDRRRVRARGEREERDISRVVPVRAHRQPARRDRRLERELHHDDVQGSTGVRRPDRRGNAEGDRRVPTGPTRARPRIIVAAVAVLAVLAATGVLRIARLERVLPSIVPTGPERVPAFAFAVTRTGALPTAAIRVRKPVRTDPMLRVRGPSKRASREVIATI